MDRVIQDIRIALRGFRRAPSFTATAILILGVGIGMAVAMFMVFDAVLLRTLPVRDQDSVVELYTYRGDPNADYYLLREDLPKVAATSRTMRGIAGIAHWGAASSPLVDGDRPIVVQRTTVTGNFFDVLGTRAALGRLLVPTDEVPGAEPVLVLSHGAWRKHFAGDANIVGRRLLEPYGRTRYRIVGVAPPGLDYPAGVEVWMPAWQPSDKLSVIAIARLAPNATALAAQSEFLGTMNRLFPDRAFDGVHVETFTQAVVGEVRPALRVLGAAVGLLLLIACVNVGNLLLLRATSRARELSIRRALGATYGDVARQLVVESGLLGLAGGMLGLLCSVALIRLLIAFAPPGLPRIDVVGLAGAPIGVAVVVTSIAVLAFGVVPALLASRGHLATSLRFDARAGTETSARRRVRYALVASQVALALVMLAGAGLLGRSLARLQGVDLGYTSEHLSVLSTSFPPSEWNDASGKFDQSRVYALGERLATAWRGVPGVTSVTPTLIPPFIGAAAFIGRLDLEGQTPEEMKTNPMVPVETGGPEYFRTFGIPIIRGRGFSETDDERGQMVAVVSESIARRLWPDEDPIGKRIYYWGPDSTTPRTVVGVAADIHYRSLRESSPSIYLPWRQAYWQGIFAIRTSGDLAAVLPALRRATHDVSPVVTLWGADTMNQLLAAPLAQPRLSAMLLLGFALVSLLLASIGLYGVMAAAVRGSTRELGVRAALGASPDRLRRAVLAQAFVVVGIGTVVGLVTALAASRLLTALLFEVSPTDPAALLGAAAILIVVSMIAAYGPARSATRVDPVTALRADQ
ncbi:MAG TPA: ADOP family duplicated permease [Gemmatimonadaceae bacterium]|jgi:predicted permease|nr:ADOP family duplicated permease [Gemmatimonadaceae bacterium]